MKKGMNNTAQATPFHIILLFCYIKNASPFSAEHLHIDCSSADADALSVWLGNCLTADSLQILLPCTVCMEIDFVSIGIEYGLTTYVGNTCC